VRRRAGSEACTIFAAIDADDQIAMVPKNSTHVDLKAGSSTPYIEEFSRRCVFYGLGQS
jgi:hypothetical protein